MTWDLEILVLVNNADTSDRTYNGTIEYQYDGAGSWYELAGGEFWNAGVTISATASTNEHTLLRKTVALDAKSSGWADTLAIRFIQKASVGSVVTAYPSGVLTLSNFGTRTTYGTSLDP